MIAMSNIPVLYQSPNNIFITLIEPSTFPESLTQLLWRKMNISNNNKDNLEDLK